jgi:hypothetical protein
MKDLETATLILIVIATMFLIYVAMGGNLVHNFYSSPQFNNLPPGIQMKNGTPLGIRTK